MQSPRHAMIHRHLLAQPMKTLSSECAEMSDGGNAVINTIELCIIAIEPQATCTIIIIIIQLVVASMCKLCEYVHRTYMCIRKYM